MASSKPGQSRATSLDPHTSGCGGGSEINPLDYGDFEGTIPKGQYGGWFRCSFGIAAIGVLDPERGYKKGDLSFTLYGDRSSRQLGVVGCVTTVAGANAPLAFDQASRTSLPRKATTSSRPTNRWPRTADGADRQGQGEGADARL